MVYGEALRPPRLSQVFPRLQATTATLASPPPLAPASGPGYGYRYQARQPASRGLARAWRWPLLSILPLALASRPRLAPPLRSLSGLFLTGERLGRTAKPMAWAAQFNRAELGHPPLRSIPPKRILERPVHAVFSFVPIEPDG